jgi:hypothetical protein
MTGDGTCAQQERPITLEGLASAQVSLNLDTRNNTLKFGVVGSGRGWWPLFTRRFGQAVWRVDPLGDAVGEKEVDALAINLKNGGAEVVLFEKGRVRANSPVWNDEGVKIVVAMEPWRVSPSNDWSLFTRRVGHEELGGVTDGQFAVRLAVRKELAPDEWVGEPREVRGKFVHLLNCTASGRRVPVPKGTPKGWANDGLLNKWESRFGKVETPTVFTTENWISQRLELKELKGVLDVPAVLDCGLELRERLREMTMPGKVYIAILEEISNCLRPPSKKTACAPLRRRDRGKPQRRSSPSGHASTMLRTRASNGLKTAAQSSYRMRKLRWFGGTPPPTRR